MIKPCTARIIVGERRFQELLAVCKRREEISAFGEMWLVTSLEKKQGYGFDKPTYEVEFTQVIYAATAW